MVACVLYETPELKDDDEKWRCVMFCTPIYSTASRFAVSRENSVHGYESEGPLRGNKWSVLKKTVVYKHSALDGVSVSSHMPRIGDEAYFHALIDTSSGGRALRAGGNPYDCIEGPEVATDPDFFANEHVVVSDIVGCDETPQRVALSWVNNSSTDDLSSYYCAFNTAWGEDPW